MPWNLRARWHAYTEIWESLWYGIWGFHLSAKNALLRRDYRALFNIPRLLDAGFYWWYKTLNQYHIRYERSPSSPIPNLMSSASGVVLELGPGLGNQLLFYDRSKITRVVGVELNPLFVPDLRAEIDARGLVDVYEIISSGIEDEPVLERAGIVPGSVDTIVSTGVLCSVDRVDVVMKGLYGLLKPGGRFVFWEHHGSGDLVTRLVQRLWNPLWRPFIGGCNLTRDVKKIILAVGEWENVESIMGDEQMKPWGLLPRVWGVLTKPGGK
ncbi:methyltransferase type 11 [Podospora conica]|nr:methyltransferase type 11 [Schizothecium conicum]